MILYKAVVTTMIMLAAAASVDKVAVSATVRKTAKDSKKNAASAITPAPILIPPPAPTSAPVVPPMEAPTAAPTAAPTGAPMLIPPPEPTDPPTEERSGDCLVSVPGPLGSQALVCNCYYRDEEDCVLNAGGSWTVECGIECVDVVFPPIPRASSTSTNTNTNANANEMQV